VLSCKSESAGLENGLPKFYVAAILGDETARELVRWRSHRAPECAIPPHLSGNVSFLHAWMAMRNRIRRIHDESHGFAPTPVIPGQFDLHVAIMCHGLNTIGALKRFIGGSRLLRPDIAIESHLTRRRLEVSVRMKGKADPVRAIYEEVYAVAIHCSLRWVTGEQFQVSWLRAAPPPAGVMTTIVSALGCPIIRGGRGVTLVYPAEAARAPVVPVKLGRWGSVVVDQFLKELKHHHRATPGAAPVTPTADRVREILAQGRLSEPMLARRLDLSVATLRRRLDAEGANFREIVFELHRNQAAALLLTDKSVADIAADMGFSDDRSFRRACHQWFGQSPAQYRAGHQETRI
jgi:AraC-like DNA-binding protein